MSATASFGVHFNQTSMTEMIHLRSHLLCLFTALLACASQPAQADVLCRAELVYRWVRTAQPSAHSTGGTASGGSTATSSPAAEVVEEVQWSTFDHQATDEASAKAGLTELLTLKRPDALDACRKLHEKLTSCVATKFSTMASTLDALSFSARRALEEAISTECRIQSGRCLDTKSSEPRCSEIKVAAVASPADDKKGGKEKKK